jgi:integrase
LVSRFLAEKQAAGLSSYYRRSMRSCLVALLRYAGKSDRVRPVKLDELEPRSWSPAEVSRLLAACDCLLPKHRPWWRTIIAVAFYCGLTQCDLFRLERQHIDAQWVLRTRRSKTQKKVVAQLPAWLVAELPSEGRLWPLSTSQESFRQTFSRIVRKAGLTGSFKQLRKSCGTETERLFPGRGHEALANTRAIFGLHYLAKGSLPAVGPHEIDIRPALPEQNTTLYAPPQRHNLSGKENSP